MGVTACGIILAATPLALWIAWTPSGFLIVLATSAASVVLLGVLLSRASSRDEAPSGGYRDELRVVLPDRFAEEVHAVSPLTYHHARVEPPRFRRAMDRLRRMMR